MKSSGVQSGQLYIVATPIGNLADITERAVAILASVDAIAVEDTRHSRKLLQHLAITTPMFALHDFNEKQKAEEVVIRIIEGESIALISDAGTPLISDPGYQLVKHARIRGIKVSPIPGVSAVIAALSCSGLASDRFTFEGFLPNKTVARKTNLEYLKSDSRTLIFYEAPHRIVACLKDMKDIFGQDRYVVVARELTKTFETIHGDNLSNLITWVEQDDNQQKGEFVLLVSGAKKDPNAIDAAAARVLEILMDELPLKQSASLASKITGIKKNALYQAGLDRRVEHDL